jgi:hypothetical protein
MTHDSPRSAEAYLECSRHGWHPNKQTDNGHNGVSSFSTSFVIFNLKKKRNVVRFRKKEHPEQRKPYRFLV